MASLSNCSKASSGHVSFIKTIFKILNVYAPKYNLPIASGNYKCGQSCFSVKGLQFWNTSPLNLKSHQNSYLEVE